MKHFAIITGLLSGLLFGIATPFSKLLQNEFNSFQLAGLLYLGAGLAMVPYILRKDNQVKMLFKAGNRIKTLGIVIFGGILGPLLLLAGLKTANAASVSIWLNMELVATSILGVLIFKDTLDRSAWAGVILTVIAGVITTFGEGSGNITSVILITAACFCWGMDNHLTALADGASPQTITFIKGFGAGTVNLIIGSLLSTQPMPYEYIGPALLVGAFSYGLSIVLYVTSAQNVGATRSQILFSTAPLWGVVLSYIIFRNSFHWIHIVTLVLLAFAIYMTNRTTHNHRHTHPAIRHVHYHRHDDGHHNHSHEGESPSSSKWLSLLSI